MIKYLVLAIFSTFLSSLAQVLLKKSTQKERASFLGEYCNRYVLGGYVITFTCMILMILVYKGLPYKYGPVFESLGYFFIAILSWLIFHERIMVKRCIGIFLIIVGIIVFSL